MNRSLSVTALGISTAIVLPLFAQTAPPVLDSVRLALRFGSDQVLIIGGEEHHSFDWCLKATKELPQPKRYAALQPGQLFVVPRENAARYLDPATKWHVGDRWKVYPGAGPPVTVVIQNLGVLQYGGCIGGYAAAIASFEVPEAANLIGGLRASEYLAAPGEGLAAVSEIPLLPVDLSMSAEPGRALDQLLSAALAGS